jgi:cytoskeletal protein RodZ
MNGGIKMKLSYRAQQILIIAVAAITCAGVVAMIQTRLNVDDTPEESSSSESEIVFETPHEIQKPAVSSEIINSSTFTPSSGVEVSEPLTDIQKPSSTPPKPTPPSSSALTNKDQKPTYSSQPTVTSSDSASETPSGGKPGQIYVPGFGWQYPTGGSCTTVGNPNDELTGNKVGIME